jgi:hypothetical protein
MTASPDRSAFERAFVAMSYALDRRGDELTLPLDGVSRETERLASALAAPERQARAQVLAAELARIVRALEERRIT